MGLCPSTSFRSSSSAGNSSIGSQAPIARFSVVNVDEFGNDGSKGVIEIFPEGLLLRRRHTSDVFWPLRSLRRYGCNEELFTFESGRHCETGPGVFAFRFKKPEKLFNLVRQTIEAEAQAMQDGSRRTQNPVSPNEVNILLPPPSGHSSSHDSQSTADHNRPVIISTTTTATSSPTTPSSLLMLSKMPETQMSGGGAQQSSTYPNHHEFVELSIPQRNNNQNSRTRPPPLNLTQNAFSQSQHKQQPHNNRWDYALLADQPESNGGGRSPRLGPSSSKVVSTRSDLTQYSQVDISKTDAVRTAMTDAPSSGLHNPTNTFTMPAVNGARSSVVSVSERSPIANPSPSNRHATNKTKTAE